MDREKTRLLGLLFKCPMNEEVSECPLKKIRLMPSLVERLKLTDKWTPSKISSLLNHHSQCLRNRENL